MKIKENNKLIPKFRFPEFENDGMWVEILLEEVAEIKTGNRDTQDKVKNGKYPFFVRSQTIEKINSFSFNGEAILTSDDGVGVGKIYHYIIGKFDFHQRVYCIFNFGMNTSGRFIYYYFSERFYKRAKQLSAKNSVDSVRRPMITKMPIFTPKFKEQQKIADCLSSLDELITANSEKLTVLKAHKKGLLQQLFPAEGEKVPKLRFSEFINDDDWEEFKLKDISPAIFDGTHQTPNYTKSGIPFFSVENINSGSKNKFISNDDYFKAIKKHKPEFDDIIVTRIGKIGVSVVVDWKFEFSIYVTLAIIKKSDMFISNYLNSYLQSEIFQNEIYKRSLLNAVPCKINMDELRKCLVMLPKKKSEQQGIADCLTSIDNKIEMQAKKIEVLKLHKKGLMQQLFPNVNDE